MEIIAAAIEALGSAAVAVAIVVGAVLVVVHK